MSNEKIYLELSEDDGVSHKFYEVTINGNDVTIRYGRIGTNGRASTKNYPTLEKANAEAKKQVKAKLKKGYEAAVIGERKKRPITRRQINSQKSKAKPAPVLWKFNSGAAAFGIFINEDYCWVGNQDGSVFVLNHDAEIINQYRLQDGVKCIVADTLWVYAGCDDGSVYDSIYCFNKAGDRLWKLGTSCGSAYSMQYLNQRVYIVTTNGSLACIDASAEAIKAAETGVIPKSKSIKAPKPIAVSKTKELETTSDPTQGVIVKCMNIKGKLRVRVLLEEYNPEWNVQFPHNLREEEALFIVNEIREAARGGFYRVYGNIRRFVP